LFNKFVTDTNFPENGVGAGSKVSKKKFQMDIYHI
jgi:hypothetical protein